MKTDVLGVAFDALTLTEAEERADALLRARKGGYIVTANPEIVLHSREDAAYAAAVNGADLVLADGVGDLYAARILGTPLPERVAGSDLTPRLLSRLAERGGSVFLYGARPGVAERAAERMKKRFPGLNVCGTNDGYGYDDEAVAAKINAAKPDFVMVCLGVPKQEKWMAKHAGKLNAGLMAGLGGTLDVFSGQVRRAPIVWQKLNLEWLYRCFEEPKRFKKIKKLPQFIFKAWRKRLGIK